MFSRALWVALLALGAGCSSGSADTAGKPLPRELIWGGQTGSLIPACGLREASVVVPQGASGFVVETGGCGTAANPEDVELTTESGEPIEVSAQPIGGGKYLVAPVRSLAPGTYKVSLADKAAAISVVEPAALPSRVGELTLLSTANCQANLELRLDAALLPYAPLLSLSVTSGGNSVLWKDFGELTAEDDSLLLSCESGNCWFNGSNLVTVRGAIAGESAQLEPATLRVNVECAGAPSGNAYSDGPGAGCGLAPREKSNSSALVVGLVLGLLGSWRRRGGRQGK